jgi:hypothetical protein
VELLQQTIINILARTYNISYADAYMRLFKAQLEPDIRIKEIIQNLININNGINVLVNRNPTINYGSIMALRCVGINDDYVMSMPLQVLQLFAADFDGDCLTVIYIPNKDFWVYAMECFNPRNAMMISRNDGRFDSAVNVFKDMIINANGLINLSRDNYSREQLEAINKLKVKYRELEE